MSETKEDEMADFFSDRFSVNISLFGVNLIFGVSDIKQGEDDQPGLKNIAVARTSLIHAKVLTMLMTKNLQEFEREMGIELPIPEKVLETLGLNLEDW